MADQDEPQPETGAMALARRFVEDIKIAAIFLTRLPVSLEGHIARARITQAMGAFPVVGGIVGGIGGAVFVVAHWLGLGVLVPAVLALAAMLATTGAFHEDGFADMADGFGGGHDRETKLVIMLDSRLGTYGTVALVTVLGLKVALIARLMDVSGSPWAVMGALTAAGALSRAVIVGIMHSLPPAKDDGQSSAAGQPDTEHVVQALIIAGIVAVLALPLDAALLGILAAILGGGAVAMLALRQIGGQTGDVLGGSQIISDLAVLLTVTVLAAQ